MTNKNERRIKSIDSESNSQVSEGLINGAKVLQAVFNDLIFGEGVKEVTKISSNQKQEKMMKSLGQNSSQNER